MEKMTALGEEAGSAMKTAMASLPETLLGNLGSVPEFAGKGEEFQRLMNEGGEDPDFEAVLVKVLPDFDEMPKEGREKIIDAIG